MKKLLALLLAGLLLLSLFACSTNDNPTNTPSSQVSEEVNSTEATEEFDPVIYVYDGEKTDLVTIERIEVEPCTVFFADDAQFFTWKAKVRNTSGKDLLAKESSMMIFYRYLDANQDVVYSIYESEGYDETIKDGQAVTFNISGIPDLSKRELESITYIEIYGYNVTNHGTLDNEFTSPIMIDVKERKVISGPSSNGLIEGENGLNADIDLPTILTENEWIKTADAGNQISLIFKADGTGVESYGTSDLADSYFEWEVDDHSTVTITVHLDGGVAITDNKLEERDGTYVLSEIASRGDYVSFGKTEWVAKK